MNERDKLLSELLAIAKRYPPGHELRAASGILYSVCAALAADDLQELLRYTSVYSSLAVERSKLKNN